MQEAQPESVTLNGTSRVPTGHTAHTGTVHTHRILAYCRVSTLEQAQEGVSLEAQKTRIHAYAEAHGYVVSAVEIEEGVSGKTLARPALQNALRRLRRCEADGLAVMRLDRLSRATSDVLALVARSEQERWALHSVSESLDTSTPHGRFAVTILAGLAQMERETIAERTKTALGELRRQGKRISGKPPLGFAFDDGRLVPVEREQIVLQEMERLRGDGFGARRIAGQLNEGGVVNPRTGRLWSPSTVASILRRLDGR
ncbi:MAG: recombinase family protein [Planctomycetota bacterium]